MVAHTTVPHAVWHGVISVTPLTVRLPNLAVPDVGTLTNDPAVKAEDASAALAAIAAVVGSDLGASFSVVATESEGRWRVPVRMHGNDGQAVRTCECQVTSSLADSARRFRRVCR